MLRNRPLRPTTPGCSEGSPRFLLGWQPIGLLLLTCGACLLGCRSRAKQDVYVQKLTTELRLMEDQLYEADYRNRILAQKLEREQRRVRGSRVDQQTGPPDISSPSESMDRVLPPPVSELGPVEEGDVVPPGIDAGEEADARDRVPLSDPTDPSSPAAPMPDAETNAPVPGESDAPPVPDTSAGSTPPAGSDTFDMGNGLEDFDLESAIDPGQPVAPEDAGTLPLGNPPETGTPSDTGTPQTMDGQNADPSFDDNLPAPNRFGLPPTEPEPPGKEDLEIPPVVPGEIIPPPTGEQQIEEPPGKVPGLPSSLDDLGQKKGAPTSPQQLSLHPGFSGAHQFHASDRMDGLMLVLTVINKDGRMMDLDDFDLDGALTIVAIDPTKPGTEARLARWDFDAEEVQQLIRRTPVSGLHVPVVWDNPIPDVDEVTIHARLQTGSERLTCQGRVNVARNARVSQWSPRAASALDRPAPTAKQPEASVRR